MDSKHDNTPTTTEEATEEASKQQFLDALLAAGDESGPAEIDREEVENDGVALSSSSDDLELPGAPTGAVNPRSNPAVSSKKHEIMYSIEKNSEPDETNEPVAEVADETSAENDSGLLILSCPKCDGELALREEHIGVEGACVWCKAPIVAGRTGADHSVKIFAIATEAVKTEDASTSSPQPDASEEPAPAAEESAAEPTSFDLPETEAKPAGDEAETNEETPAAPSFDQEETSEPAAESIATGWGSPSPAEDTKDASSGFSSPDANPPEHTDAPAPTQTEDMPPSMGFDSVPDSDEKPEQGAESFGGFSASAPDDSDDSSDPTYSGSGFGEFLSSASGTPQKEAEQASGPVANEQPPKEISPDSFSGPTPWGPPSPPSEETTQGPASFESSVDPTPGQSEAAPAEVSVERGDVSPPETAPANDFSQAANWNSPTPAASCEETDPPQNPATEFSDSLPTSPAATPPSFEEDAAPSSFSDAAADAPPVPAPEPKSDSPFSTDPSVRTVPAADGEGFPVGFNIPANGPSNSPFPSFGPTDDPPSPVEEPTANPETQSLPDTETTQEQPAPAADAPPFGSPSQSSQGADSLFGPPADSPAPSQPEAPANPFGDEQPAPAADAPPFGSFSQSSQGADSLFGPPADSPAPSQPEAPANPFGDEQPAETSPPAPAPENETSEKPDESNDAAAEEKPQVESVKLGKEKKKRGKGFFIVAAIVLGLVCGAALASFVLPVDEYVNNARSLMEQKFMPSATWEAAQNSPAPRQSAASEPNN